MATAGYIAVLDRIRVNERTLVKSRDFVSSFIDREIMIARPQSPIENTNRSKRLSTTPKAVVGTRKTTNP
jgi:hypothetical protein